MCMHQYNYALCIGVQGNDAVETCLDHRLFDNYLLFGCFLIIDYLIIK
jgi:hypothetical protein